MGYENIPKNEDNTKVLVETENINAAFGAFSTVELTAITQIESNYGLLEGVFTLIDGGVSGSNTVVDSKFTCQTGVAATGLASILTLRQVSHKAGQGLVARFNTVFDTAVADSLQAAGMITAENSVVFAYFGATFGILYAHGGLDELQELTLTVAGGAENVNITVDAVVYVVALSGLGTVQGDAFEIAASLQTQVPNYSFTANDDQVVAQAIIPGPMGAFAYASAGTSVGAWVQLTAGVVNTNVFIPQATWNIDTKADLDPTLGNVYQIQLQDAYFGPVDFYIADNATGNLVLVHSIRTPNTTVETLFSNPSFRIGWLVNNQGNTTNLTIQGAAASGFIEGRSVASGPTRSSFQDQLSIGSTLTNVVSVRNRITFGGKVNRAELFIKLVSASSQTNRIAFFQIVVNPTFAATPIFLYEDKGASISEICKSKVTLTGGKIIGTVAVVDSGSQLIEFTEKSSPPILPGDTVCIAAIIPTGATADCQGTITWQEDI